MQCEHVFALYAELHSHSAFSFLDGASLPEELATAAVALEYDALALTDHNTVSGSMEFAEAAAGLGLRAIHGAEIDLVEADRAPGVRNHEVGRHLTLLVEDGVGWRNLCRILTRAHAHTRDGPSSARRIEIPPAVPLEFVEAHAAGLVCLSGCATRGVHDEVTLRRLLGAFGHDGLRVELQRPFQRHDRARNRRLAGLAARLGVQCVATGNVHAHARARAPLQDAFVALRHHTALDSSEPMRRGNFAHVLASPAAMAARFEDHPAAVAGARELADRLRFDLRVDLGYRYPGSEDPDADRRLAELCAARFDDRYPPGDRCRSEAQARLEEEQRVIGSLGLAGFFLLHHELLELAREVAAEVRGPDTARALLPPGRGRGSSVSSLVCYLTGLSHIDPVRNDLFLGRFLNEELTALPDIDLDFPRDVRERLIPRVHARYGRERSALVAAFPTFKSRGAIRELGKVLGLPPGEIERIARGAEPFAVRGVAHDVAVGLGLEIPGPRPDPLARDPEAPAPFAQSTTEWLEMARRWMTEEEWRAAARGEGLEATERWAGDGPPPGPAPPLPAKRDERRYAGLPGRWAWLARLCDEAYGLPRHLSQHSGGMIVSTRPLIDCCPVLPAAMEGRQLCMWDKDSCADAGFLKIDLLGLGMLSCVERCVEEIARVRGERIDLSRIPYDDPATYDAIQSADTMGVFQIESRAQMASLRRTRPETLEDLTIQVAIVRPGPILGGAVNPYIERRQRMRNDPDFEVPYDHPSLEPVLRDTLGTIIFQDQVIEVAMAFAGFSPGEAEGLRRAMSRKRSVEAIEAFHQRFLDGAARAHGGTAGAASSGAAPPQVASPQVTDRAHPVTREVAERVWSMIEGFSGFGFPKAHGAAFGLLAYQSTWLRVHYGPEFLASLLNEQPMGFYASDTLSHEAQRRGIEMLAPDVNESEVECVVVAPELPAANGAAPPAANGAAPSAANGAAPPAPSRVRLGLAYVLGARSAELETLVEARRAGGRFRSPADLASRAGAGSAALERLAWAGACDSLVGREGSARRRTALWELGVAMPGLAVGEEGTQLSLPLEIPPAPPLEPLVAWDAMVADYATTGLTLGPHPMALVRPRLPRGTVSIADLETLPHASTVRLGGLVVARQRPGTAKGIVFILLEDEFGTVNLIVPPQVYDRHRLTVRAEPLIMAQGRLERLAIAGGAINVLVHGLQALEVPDTAAAEVVSLASRAAAAAAAEGTARAGAESPAAVAAAGAGEATEAASDFRGVAPAVQSFASGRRR
jgi:error-prone DNA polymerase